MPNNPVREVDVEVEGVEVGSADRGEMVSIIRFNVVTKLNIPGSFVLCFFGC